MYKSSSALESLTRHPQGPRGLRGPPVVHWLRTNTFDLSLCWLGWTAYFFRPSLPKGTRTITGTIALSVDGYALEKKSTINHFYSTIHRHSSQHNGRTLTALWLGTSRYRGTTYVNIGNWISGLCTSIYPNLCNTKDLWFDYTPAASFPRLTKKNIGFVYYMLCRSCGKPWDW